MKIKLEKLFLATQTLIKIFNFQYEDVKTTYWVSRIAKKLNPEIEALEKSRIELLKKHSKEDKDGTLIIEDKKRTLNKPNFTPEFDALLETEIDIEPLELRLEILQEVKLRSPNELLVLEGVLTLIADPTEEATKIINKKL